MTTERKLEILGKHVVELCRESAKIQAKLNALEAMVRSKTPKNQHAVWNAQMKKLTATFLQELYEAYEKRDPGFAAWLDDRKADELENL